MIFTGIGIELVLAILPDIFGFSLGDGEGVLGDDEEQNAFLVTGVLVEQDLNGAEGSPSPE